jgi:hypothetical protein
MELHVRNRSFHVGMVEIPLVGYHKQITILISSNAINIKGGDSSKQS